MRRWIGALFVAGVLAAGAAAGTDEQSEEEAAAPQEPMGAGRPAKPKPAQGAAAPTGAPAPTGAAASPGMGAPPRKPPPGGAMGSPASSAQAPSAPAGAASSTGAPAIPRSPWATPPASSLRGVTGTAAPRPAAPSLDEPPVAVGWTGQRWQYHVEMLIWEEYKELPEYQQLEKELGGAFRATFEFQERVLERAGQQGWELAELRVPKESAPATVVLYMKRLLPPASAGGSAPAPFPSPSAIPATPTGGVPAATGWTSPGDPTLPPGRR